MGTATKNLLVVVTLVFYLINIAQARVDAENYTAFWLWSGVKAQPVLDKATTLYILQAQIDKGLDGQVYFTKQGNGIIRVSAEQLWLVYRVHTLAWNDEIFSSINNQLAQWQAAGITVTGIQIDFDVPTRQLNSYIEFLRSLRKQLSPQYKLSITGLLDWGANADPQTLNNLANTVDEVVLQTYQGRNTITNYQTYLNKLKKLTIPFKIGLIQYGEWQEPIFLKQHNYFLGYVIFLQNP